MTHMNKQIIYIIRGVPGSGKTTEAKRMMDGDPDLQHFEADMFFETKGEYNFNFAKIKEAHEWCQSQVHECLKNGKSVIVSNTFVRKWEMEVYIKMAKELGINYEIKRMIGGFQNVHGVPETIVERMRRDFQI